MRVMEITFFGGLPPVGEVYSGRVGGTGLSGARALGYNVVIVVVWHRDWERGRGNRSSSKCPWNIGHILG